MTKSSNHTEHSTASWWGAGVQARRDRKAVRALRDSVERELSSYSTVAEQRDFDAMLDRYVGPADIIDTQMIERIRLKAA